MKIGERLQDTRKFIINMILLLLIGAIVFWMGTIYSSKGSEPEITDSSLYSQLNEISELSVLEYRYSKVGKFENSLTLNGWEIPLTQKSFLLTYSGSLKVGIDMKDVNINIKGKTIYITLPEVTIIANTIDEKSIEVYDETHNIFNPISISDYKAFATQQKNKVEEEAIENGIFNEAATKAEQNIRSFLKAFPEIDNDYKIEISFASK